MEGNQQKMRETLLVVRDALDTISAHEDDIEFVRAWIGQTKNAVQDALSEPPRQCDVSAEDSITQFQEFCESHDCETCEYLRFKDRGERYACAIAWMEANAERGDLCHED